MNGAAGGPTIGVGENGPVGGNWRAVGSSGGPGAKGANAGGIGDREGEGGVCPLPYLVYYNRISVGDIAKRFHGHEIAIAPGAVEFDKFMAVEENDRAGFPVGDGAEFDLGLGSDGKEEGK